MRPLNSILLGLLLGSLMLSSAQAQEPPQGAAAAPAPGQPAVITPAPAAPAANAEDAREHFKRGEAAYQKGSYDVAIAEWNTAYGADPRPRIQYNIYQARERLGQLVEAVEALQKYLSTADPDDPYYSDATARMASLQQRLQATGVRLVGGPDGASINVSGHDWGRLPRPDRIPVQPGNHRITVTLAGYKDFVTNVIVPAGQSVDVPVQLEPLSPSGSNATAGAQASASSGGSHTSGTPFFIASGVLGAGAIATAIWAINRGSELDGCDDPQFFCPNKSAVTTQRTLAWGLTAALGAGAIGTLIYGLIVNGQSADERALLCLPDGAGAICRARF
jgi:hypothetical protein